MRCQARDFLWLQREAGRGERPMVEVERLEEGTEGSIRALLALGEVAAVNLADEDNYPDEHRDHSDEAGEDTLDKIDDQQISGVPRPEYRVDQVAIAKDETVAEGGEELCDDEADDDFKDGADGHVVVDSED